MAFTLLTFESVRSKFPFTSVACSLAQNASTIRTKHIIPLDQQVPRVGPEEDKFPKHYIGRWIDGSMGKWIDKSMEQHGRCMALVVMDTLISVNSACVQRHLLPPGLTDSHSGFRDHVTLCQAISCSVGIGTLKFLVAQLQLHCGIQSSVFTVLAHNTNFTNTNLQP